MRTIFLLLFLSVNILAIKLSFDILTPVSQFNFDNIIKIEILPSILSIISKKLDLDSYGITQINHTFPTLIINVKELSGTKSGWFTFRIKRQNDSNELNVSLISTSF